jgi:hypothetical protein
VRPLFLLSLPRSGSTLVQRVLGAEPRVAATAGEPWLMLPLLSLTRAEGTRADYWHESAAEAIGELVERLDGGYDGWKAELRGFAEGVYGRAATGAGKPGAAYFLDKTPRYHLLARELLELFPDARFVFLWRHPLAVVSSLLETFRAGRFEPYSFGVDLYAGVNGLHRAWAERDERCHGVRYEDLVAGPGAWEALYGFLGLDWDPAAVERLPAATRSTYGDPTGIAAYDALSAEPLAKWRGFVRGPVRKRWARRYLEWIGPERMAAMGYDLAQALAEVDAAPGGGISARDAAQLAASRRAERARRRALELPEGPRPLGAAFEDRKL